MRPRLPLGAALVLLAVSSTVRAQGQTLDAAVCEPLAMAFISTCGAAITVAAAAEPTPALDGSACPTACLDALADFQAECDEGTWIVEGSSVPVGNWDMSDSRVEKHDIIGRVMEISGVMRREKVKGICAFPGLADTCRHAYFMATYGAMLHEVRLSEKGVRLAQTMQVGPRIPVEIQL